MEGGFQAAVPAPGPAEEIDLAGERANTANIFAAGVAHFRQAGLEQMRDCVVSLRDLAQKSFAGHGGWALPVVGREGAVRFYPARGPRVVIY